MRGRKVRLVDRIPREKEIFFFEASHTATWGFQAASCHRYRFAPGTASYSLWPYCGQHRAGVALSAASGRGAMRYAPRPSGWGNTAHAGIIQAAGDRLSWG